MLAGVVLQAVSLGRAEDLINLFKVPQVSLQLIA